MTGGSSRERNLDERDLGTRPGRIRRTVVLVARWQRSASDFRPTGRACSSPRYRWAAVRGVPCLLRRLDGSTPVRLGERPCARLSLRTGPGPLATIQTPRARPSAHPDGTRRDEGARATVPSLAYHWASFFPDGKTVLIAGNESGRPIRLFAQDLSGGPPDRSRRKGCGSLSPAPASRPTESGSRQFRQGLPPRRFWCRPTRESHARSKASNRVTCRLRGSATAMPCS